MDGLSFWCLRGVDMHQFALEVGFYGNGRVGIRVQGDRGSECKLTFNLDGVPLQENEFIIDNTAVKYAEHVVNALRNLGLIEPTLQRVPYGPYDSETTVWLFSSCEHGVRGACEHCVGELRKQFEAANAAYRLGGIYAARKELEKGAQSDG